MVLYLFSCLFPQRQGLGFTGHWVPLAWGSVCHMIDLQYSSVEERGEKEKKRKEKRKEKREKGREKREGGRGSGERGRNHSEESNLPAACRFWITSRLSWDGIFFTFPSWFYPNRRSDHEDWQVVVCLNMCVLKAGAWEILITIQYPKQTICKPHPPANFTDLIPRVCCRLEDFLSMFPFNHDG